MRKSKKSPQPIVVADLFVKVASEKVVVETGGGKVTMTRWEAFVRKVQSMALSGNSGAARLLAQMSEIFPPESAASRQPIFIISASDAKL